MKYFNYPLLFGVLGYLAGIFLEIGCLDDQVWATQNEGPVVQCGADVTVKDVLSCSVNIVSGNISVDVCNLGKFGTQNVNRTQKCILAGQRARELTLTIANKVWGLPDIVTDKHEFYETCEQIKLSLSLLQVVVNMFSLDIQKYSVKFAALVNHKIGQFKNIVDRFSFENKIVSNSSLKAATCKIELVGVGSYLYAHSAMGEDNLQRPVYVSTVSGSQAEWIMEPVNSSGAFRLKNRQYNQYLGSFVPWPSSAGQTVLAVTSTQYYQECESRFIWNMVDDAPNMTRLKHQPSNSYLTAPVGFPSRVAVLNKVSSSTYWKLTCTG